MVLVKLYIETKDANISKIKLFINLSRKVSTLLMILFSFSSTARITC